VLGEILSSIRDSIYLITFRSRMREISYFDTAGEFCIIALPLATLLAARVNP